MYRQNNRYLKNNYPIIARNVQALKTNSFQVKSSSQQTKYISGEIGNQKVSIHSAYNPEREAILILDSYQEELKKYEYILCVGAGLGYHIHCLQEKYPSKHIFLYEPSLEIFSLFLSEFDLSRLDGLYVGKLEQNLEEMKSELFPKRPLILTMPIYEKIFSDECYKIVTEQLNFLKSKEMEMVVYAKNGMKWVYNGVHNHTTLMDTPSVLHQEFKSYFSQKPVVLVSAGPSLDEELENLRQIKEKGLAYIFSVGSAIRTLVAHEVYPHAACSHDSGYMGMKVYAPIIEKRIKEIPLFFGSTVPDDLLREYPGEKGHFLIHQDRFNTFLLDEEIVYDAATVATVLLQIFFKWKVPRIILVGQNLSFKGDKIYSNDIDYYQSFNDRGLNVEQLEKVLSVDGEQIYASLTHKKMRENMEGYIQIYGQNTEILNATKGGAQIKGTKFIPLEEVISKYLTEQVTEPQWFHTICSNIHNKDMENKRQSIEQNFSRLHLFKENFQTNLLEIEKLIGSLQENIDRKDFEKVARNFSKYSKKLEQVESNVYYQILIVPFIEMVLQEKENQMKIVLERKQSEQEQLQQRFQIIKEKFELIGPVHRWIDQEMNKLNF